MAADGSEDRDIHSLKLRVVMAGEAAPEITRLTSQLESHEDLSLTLTIMMTKMSNWKAINY